MLFSKAARPQPLKDSGSGSGGGGGSGRGKLIPKTEASVKSTAKPKTPRVEKRIVHFGQNPNQSRHTFRHTKEYGLQSKQVESAVEQDLRKNMHKIDLNKSYKGIVKVNGVELEYNAYEIASGEINVGKITIKKK
jgi:hypothetical protein